ncbi:MAG: hypothetical protein [Circular genetic element sp.]|nr:MAG: hypothetical protein [Circular genetic element sp.]
MARRKSTRGSKIQPAVQTLTFALSAPGGGTTSSNYIDLSQVASLVNRRFYRQGINWAVAGFKFLTASSFSGQISVNKLPNTWVMSNAWEKSFRAWSQMNREAISEAQSIRPKFLDFKIYADAEHHAAGYAANLLPVGVGDHLVASLTTPGQWVSSKFVIPKTNGTDDTISHEIVAVGPNYPGTGASGLNAVSLIEGYAASRSLPDILDPNLPDDALLANGSTPQNYLGALFNEGTDQTADVIEDMRFDNKIAPYPFENDGTNPDTMYPNGANQLTGLQIHSIETVTPTTIGGTTRIKGGNFPCGLISVDTLNDGDTAGIVIQIDLIPGNHRGYLCEPMTEM